MCLKKLTDQLATIGKAVSHKDRLAYMLEGLAIEYDAFVSAVYNRADDPSIEKIQSLLVSYELRLEKRNVVQTVALPEAYVASAREQFRRQPQQSTIGRGGGQ